MGGVIPFRGGYKWHKIVEDGCSTPYSLYFFIYLQVSKVWKAFLFPEEHHLGEHLAHILNKTTFSNDTDSFPRTKTHNLPLYILYILLKLLLL